jgi:peptide methionine sulfoxide reductase msrA/msrB
MMTKKAYFAAGCFWGVEHLFKKVTGVIETTVGYCGGEIENPTYEQVSTGETGHQETVEVVYDPQKISYSDLVKIFFEIHNFTQKDGQGPDKGMQYLSVVFTSTPEEKEIVKKHIDYLRKKGYDVATQIKEFDKFWPAEDYHQDYYSRTMQVPYCHYRRNIKWEI